MNATATPDILEHQIGETGSLAVRVANWDVEVVAVAGDTVRVRNANGRRLPDNLEVEQDAGRLAIRQPSRLGFDVTVGRRSALTKLTIEVPASAEVIIQTASGDIQAARLRGPVQVRTASGDVLLVDVAGEVHAETVSGDVAIRLDGPTVLTAKSVSGDAIVEGSRVDRFTYTSTSGDLRLASELGEGPHAIATVSGDAMITTPNGIRVLAQTLTGDLKTDLPHTSEGRPGRRSLTVGEGSAVVQFRSISGDLRVVGANGGGQAAAAVPPAPPVPPAAPFPPATPTPAEAPAPAATASAASAGTEPTTSADGADAPAAVQLDSHADPAVEVVRLDVLRALERGEISIEEATDRLSALDGQSDD